MNWVERAESVFRASAGRKPSVVTPGRARSPMDMCPTLIVAAELIRQCEPVPQPRPAG